MQLTNSQPDPVSVAAIAVVFYNEAGTELGSDTPDATGIIISNQSLYWVNEMPSNVSAASRCDVVGWNGP